MSTSYKQILTKGFRSSLENLAVENGKIRVATDSKQLFLDLEDERIEITDFEKQYSEEEIQGLLAPLSKIYLSSDTHKLFIYDADNQEWIICGEANIKVPARALSADNATNASTADYAKNAGTATYATNAGTSYYSASANTASNAGTSDYARNAGTATSALNDGNGKQINTTYAPLNSPMFTGTPTAPTASEGTSSEQIANTAFVANAILKAIANVVQFDTDVLDELPETGVAGKIYFVPNNENENSNTYNEYIWVNDSFEKIGSTTIDLTGYFNDYEVTGTGNAVTNVSVQNGKVSFEKGSSFLTEHPEIEASSSTGSETPDAGDNIEMVDSVQVDGNGHLVSFRTKTVTLPDKVTTATNASTADYAKVATNASTADYASSAVNATNASTADYAKDATNASTSTYARNAGTSSYASTARNDILGNEITKFITSAEDSGASITFTRADGTTFTIAANGTTYTTMTAATESTNGTSGLVPAPNMSEESMFLGSDATWHTMDFGDLDE